jgi:hypothetical protein
MSEQINQYKLNRNIGAGNIKKLRTEVNCVCPARDVKGPCSSLFLTWHHFDPLFKDCREHNPEGIIALCPTHASRADAGEYSKQDLKYWKKNPNVKDIRDIREHVGFLHRNDLIVNLANSFLKGNRANIKCGDSYINIHKDQNGLIVFNMKINDIGNKDLFYMRDNVFQPATQDIVIECKPESINLKIKGERTEVNISGKRIEANAYDATLKKIAREYVAKRRKAFKKIQKGWKSFPYKNPSIERLMESIKHDKKLGLFKDVNTENEIKEKALQLRKQIVQTSVERMKLTEKDAERNFVGNEEEHFEELKSQIHPDDLLIFIKGKIFCGNAFADLNEGFRAPDNSAIFYGLFSDPDIEIGENFVGSR